MSEAILNKTDRKTILDALDLAFTHHYKTARRCRLSKSRHEHMAVGDKFAKIWRQLAEIQGMGAPHVIDTISFSND